METALNRVEENKKKQMKVLQASLQRTEKNYIRQAVRKFKEKRIEMNIQEKNNERIESIKHNFEKRTGAVEKRKVLMSAA